MSQYNHIGVRIHKSLENLRPENLAVRLGLFLLGSLVTATYGVFVQKLEAQRLSFNSVPVVHNGQQRLSSEEQPYFSVDTRLPGAILTSTEHTENWATLEDQYMGFILRYPDTLGVQFIEHFDTYVDVDGESYNPYGVYVICNLEKPTPPIDSNEDISVLEDLLRDVSDSGCLGYEEVMRVYQPHYPADETYFDAYYEEEPGYLSTLIGKVGSLIEFSQPYVGTKFEYWEGWEEQGHTTDNVWLTDDFTMTRIYNVYSDDPRNAYSLGFRFGSNLTVETRDATNDYRYELAPLATQILDTLVLTK